MFDKSIVLNFKISAREFGLGTGLAVFSALLMYQDLSTWNSFALSYRGILSLIALLGFLATLVFYVMGFHKLFYKSLFSQEAHLYMSLPISNLQVLLSKIFVASFWLLILIAILAYSAFTAISALVNQVGLLDFLVSSFLLNGIPAESIGFHLVFLLWADILSAFVFSATLLFAIIFANTLKVKRFKIGVNLLVVPACFAINGLIFYNINQRLDFSLLSLLVPLILLVAFVYLSEKLLTNKYNLE